MWKTTGIGLMAGPPSGYDRRRARWARPVSGTAGADEATAETEAGQVHGLPGFGSLDHGAGTDVHGNVLRTTGTVEEEITWLEVAERHRGGVTHLGARIVGKADAHLTPGPRREPRAVESRVSRTPGGLASPDIGD